METSSLRLLGIIIIVIVNSVATVITLAFWILVLSRFFGGAHLHTVLEKASKVFITFARLNRFRSFLN